MEAEWGHNFLSTDWELSFWRMPNNLACGHWTLALRVSTVKTGTKVVIRHVHSANTTEWSPGKCNIAKVNQKRLVWFGSVNPHWLSFGMCNVACEQNHLHTCYVHLAVMVGKILKPQWSAVVRSKMTHNFKSLNHLHACRAVSHAGDMQLVGKTQLICGFS